MLPPDPVTASTLAEVVRLVDGRSAESPGEAAGSAWLTALEAMGAVSGEDRERVAIVPDDLVLACNVVSRMPTVIIARHLAPGPDGRPLDVIQVWQAISAAGGRVTDGTIVDDRLVLATRPTHRHDEGKAAEASEAVRDHLVRREHGVLLDMAAALAHSRRDREQLHTAVVAGRARFAAFVQAQQAEAADQRADLGRAERELRTLRALRAQLTGARERADRYQARIEVLEGRLATLRTRRWWRLGEALGGAARSPREMLRLPFAVLRSLRAPPARPVERTAVATAASPEQQPAAAARSRDVTNSPLPSTASGEPRPGPKPTVPVIPRVPIAVPEVGRRALRMAAILGPDSASAFSYEVALQQLSRQGWRDDLDRVAPQLLLIEAAVWAATGPWHQAIGSHSDPADDLRALVAACRSSGVATVFWSNHPARHIDRFAATGHLFDRVFALDDDMAERWSTQIGADRVGVLPFAAQPRIHHPASVQGGREYPVAALSELPREAPRANDPVNVLLEPATEFGLNLFSPWGDDTPKWVSEPLANHLVGSLDAAERATAYKRYRLFLETGSGVIDGAPTYSRRLLELVASGTPVLASRSPGIDRLLGTDVVAHSDSADATRHVLRLMLNNAEPRDRVSARGIRSVHRDHTYARRVEHVAAAVGLGSTTYRSSTFSAVVATRRPEALDDICANLRRQNYGAVQLVLVTHGFEASQAEVIARLDGTVQDVRLVAAPSHLGLGAVTNLGFEAADGELLAKMDDDDHYGPNYVNDQALAFSYTDAAIVGKRSVYTFFRSMDAAVVRMPGHEHRIVEQVAGPTMVMRREVFAELPFPDLPRAIDTEIQRRANERGLPIYSTDRYNFIYVRRPGGADHTWPLGDVELASRGRVAFYGWNTAQVDV